MSHRHPVLLQVGLALAVPAGACSLFRSAPEPSRSRDRIRAAHMAHVDARVECLQCHEEIYEAKALDRSFHPAEEICLQCHQEEKDKENCSFCHTDVRHAASRPKPKPYIQLSHADHIELVDERCERCHVALSETGRTRHLTPPMERCLSCHEHRNEYDGARCDRCHVDLSSLRPTSVFSHQSGFVDTHRLTARSSAAVCAQCHDQTFCADCHASTVAARIELRFPERTDRAFIHRNDFIGRHAIEARADPARCRHCHGSSFCDSCHTLQNLTPRGTNPRDPHPRGWAFPGSVEFHGSAARRDIASCAACHDQGARSICVDCHRVGGIGGNPHPESWLGRHPDSEIRTNAMCRYCHL